MPAFRSRFLAILASAVPLFTLSGCGGGGEDEPVQPTITVDFPAAYSYVEAASYSAITVRGRASAGGTITGVTVNGVAASSDDGFATWQASVPLENAEGVNALRATLALAADAEAAAAELTVETVPPVASNFSDIALDPGSETVYVASSLRRAIYAWHRDMPARWRLVAGEDRRAGVDPIDVHALAWDSREARLIGISDNRLFAVDPNSGTVTVLADNNGTGEGPAVSSGWLAVDSGRQLAYLLQVQFPSPARLIRFDLTTGDREEILMTGGEETSLSFVTAMALDAEGQRLFVARGASHDVVQVNLVDGLRTRLPTPDPILGNQIVGLAYDATGGNSLLLTANEGPRRTVYRMTMATGALTIVSANDHGGGPAFGRVQDVLITADGQRAYVGDVDLNAIVAVDIGSGDRSAVHPALGEGPALMTPVDLVLSDVGERLHVVDTARNQLLALPADGGARSDFGSADVFGDRPKRLVRALDAPALYALDYDDEMYAVDAAGTVQPLNLNPRDLFDAPYIRGLVVDHGAQQAFFIVAGVGEEEDRIGRVDLAAGTGEIISGGGKGSGESMIDATSLTWHSGEAKLVVWNRDSAVLVDPKTGDREFRPANQPMYVDHVHYEPTSGRLLLATFSDLFEFSLQDGTMHAVVTENDGKGMNGINYADGFAYDPEREVFFVATSDVGAVLMVDAVSGEEVMLSR